MIGGQLDGIISTGEWLAGASSSSCSFRAFLFFLILTAARAAMIDLDDGDDQRIGSKSLGFLATVLY